MEKSFEFHSTPELSFEDYCEGNGFKPRMHGFEPLGYPDFLNLMGHTKVVLTDSGGIQEETPVLNIPCITLRDTTERPITLSEGTNVLVKDDPKRIVEEVEKVLAGEGRKGTCPEIWDGHTAERIVKILAEPGTSHHRTRKEQIDPEDPARPVEPGTLWVFNWGTLREIDEVTVRAYFTGVNPV